MQPPAAAADRISELCHGFWPVPRAADMLVRLGDCGVPRWGTDQTAVVVMYVVWRVRGYVCKRRVFGLLQ